MENFIAIENFGDLDVQQSPDNTKYLNGIKKCSFGNQCRY